MRHRDAVDLLRASELGALGPTTRADLGTPSFGAPRSTQRSSPR